MSLAFTNNFIIPSFLFIVTYNLRLAVVLITKIILSQFFRISFFSAFYRKMPYAANVFTTVIEVYSIGISVWFMLVRAIKIMVIGALYIGRIDT